MLERELLQTQSLKIIEDHIIDERGNIYLKYVLQPCYEYLMAGG